MTRTTKILIAGLLVLFFVAVAEIGFYFFNQNKARSNLTPQPGSMATLPTKPFYEVKPSTLSGTPAVPQIKNVGTSAIPVGLLGILNSLNKAVLTSSIITNEYSGNVVELINKEEVVNGKKYQLQIKIQAKDASNYTMRLMKEDLDVTTVSQSVNGKITLIDISQIKVGDNVMISSISDLKRAPARTRTRVTITKL